MYEQVAIALFGVTATFLSQDHRLSWQRWACVFGLASQPFWFYSAWKAEQWGIVFLVFVYGGCWVRGFYTFWIKR